MGRKKLDDGRTITLSFKVNRKEHHKILAIAKLYTKEGLSDFMRMRVLCYDIVIGKKPSPEGKG